MPVGRFRVITLWASNVCKYVGTSVWLVNPHSRRVYTIKENYLTSVICICWVNRIVPKCGNFSCRKFVFLLWTKHWQLLISWHQTRQTKGTPSEQELLFVPEEFRFVDGNISGFMRKLSLCAIWLTYMRFILLKLALEFPLFCQG